MRRPIAGRRLTVVAALALTLVLAVAAIAGANGRRGDHGQSHKHNGHGHKHYGHGPQHGHGHGHWHPHPPQQPDPLSAEALHSTIRQYASVPDHYTGTPNSAAAQSEVARRFASYGLKLDSVSYTFPSWEPIRVSLKTDSGAVPSAAIAPLPYSGITPYNGISGQLFDGGKGTFDPSAAEGKIVVSSAVAGASLAKSIKAAQEGDAKALVFITKGFADYIAKENVNSRVGTGDFPVLLASKKTGAGILADATAGESARLVMAAKTGIACDTDTLGVLPGRDQSRRVFVGTPTSSLVPSAAERGGGVAILLGLAEYYTKLPKSQRPVSLVFVATTGHETGFLGLEALINAKGDWYTGADAYIHLGASLGAMKAVENPDGTATFTPGVQSPGGSLRPSENPVLQALTSASFAAAGQPLPAVEPHISGSGEQMWAYAEGIPTLSFNGTSLFFHTGGDLPGVVDPDLLAREADGFRRVVDSISALAPGELRGANGQADAFGAAVDPRDSSPENLVFGEDGVGGPAPKLVPSCARYRH